MERSAEAYERLIARLRETLPDVAQQIEDAVAEGQRVEAVKLPAGERLSRIADADGLATRISKDDLISLPYTGDDRLRLLLTALRTLSHSMLSSRETLNDFVAERNLSHELVFRGDDIAAAEVRIDAGAIVENESSRLSRADRELAEAIRAIQ